MCINVCQVQQSVICFPLVQNLTTCHCDHIFFFTIIFIIILLFLLCSVFYLSTIPSQNANRQQKTTWFTLTLLPIRFLLLHPLLPISPSYSGHDAIVTLLKHYKRPDESPCNEYSQPGGGELPFQM